MYIFFFFIVMIDAKGDAYTWHFLVSFISEFEHRRVSVRVHQTSSKYPRLVRKPNIRMGRGIARNRGVGWDSSMEF